MYSIGASYPTGGHVGQVPRSHDHGHRGSRIQSDRGILSTFKEIMLKLYLGYNTIMV